MRSSLSLDVLLMTRFLQDVQYVDRLSQAVAVLGGTTSPSYEAVSLQNAESTVETALGISSVGSESLNGTNQHTVDLDSLLGGDRPTVEVAPAQVRNTNFSNGFTDEPIGLDASQLLQGSQDPELLTRFQTQDSDPTAPSATQPSESRLVADGTGESSATSSGSMSLSSFLDELVAQIEASSGDVSTEFSGSTQGAVRELVFEIGSELSTSVRQEFQDNLAGVGRELAEQVIDSVGIDPLSKAFEPLLAVDYYGESALVINGILDGIGQPIGSVSLPQVSPLTANFRNELTGLSA